MSKERTTKHVQTQRGASKHPQLEGHVPWLEVPVTGPSGTAWPFTGLPLRALAIAIIPGPSRRLAMFFENRSTLCVSYPAKKQVDAASGTTQASPRLTPLLVCSSMGPKASPSNGLRLHHATIVHCTAAGETMHFQPLYACMDKHSQMSGVLSQNATNHNHTI